MQDRGLEWLFRLSSEPTRLWRRYLVAGARFAAMLGNELLSRAPKLQQPRQSGKRRDAT
jgi:N-acetylglucosaminyldiphosphoundecaprenol N-acetyl-beta-D-mannosaminyltransferase